MRTYFTIIFFAFFSLTGYGQEIFSLRSSSISSGSNVLLRWAPINFFSFNYSMNNGYKIIRTTIRQSDTLLSGYQMYQSKVVLDSMILPLAEMDWESMADTNDMAGIAAMALYGEEVQVMSVDSVDFMEVANLNVSVRPTPSSPAFSGSVILP